MGYVLENKGTKGMSAVYVCVNIYICELCVCAQNGKRYGYIHAYRVRNYIRIRCHNHVYNSHVSILMSMDVYVQLSIDKVQVTQLRLTESKTSVVN